MILQNIVVIYKTFNDKNCSDTLTCECGGLALGGVKPTFGRGTLTFVDDILTFKNVNLLLVVTHLPLR